MKMGRMTDTEKNNYVPSVKHLKNYAIMLYKQNNGLRADTIAWAAKHIEQLESQNAEHLATIEQLREQNLRILHSNFAQICSYCGWEAPISGASWGELQDHIKICPEHPVYKLTQENEQLQERVARLVDAGNAYIDEVNNENQTLRKYEMTKHNLVVALSSAQPTADAFVKQIKAGIYQNILKNSIKPNCNKAIDSDIADYVRMASAKLK
jgi:hypothetical protein